MKTKYLLSTVIVLTTLVINVYAQTWNEVTKVVASDRALNDQFGFAVGISGNYAIVGARFEDENAIGLDTLNRAGSAYIFERDTFGNWNQVQKIVASDRTAENYFGVSVNISGNYAIVGTWYNDTDTSGGNYLTDAGAAYIFERDSSGSWSEVQKIVASDRAVLDGFGFSLSISGNHVIVGVPQEDEDALGANTMYSAGSAYIFERDTSGYWNQVQKIVALDRDTGDAFGISGISGNYAIVGAGNDDEDASGANTLLDAGSAYIFERDTSGNWSEVQKIVASDRAAEDKFGVVSISGNYAVVGAYTEDEDATGGNTLLDAGSAYIFERDTSGNWSEVQKIVASDRAAGNRFGYPVSISGEHIIVGDNYLAGGHAYIFEMDTFGNWNEVQIIAPDVMSDVFFGAAVGISGNYVIVGSRYVATDASGGNTVPNAGAAYLFERINNTGITEISLDTSFTVYPNPFSAYTFIKFENHKKEKHTLTIYNSLGQLVRQIDNINEGQVKIEKKNLTSGLYFFQLRNDIEIVGNGKLIIE